MSQPKSPRRTRAMQSLCRSFPKEYGLERVTRFADELQALIPQLHDPSLIGAVQDLQGGLHAAIRVQSCGTRAEGM